MNVYATFKPTILITLALASFQVIAQGPDAPPPPRPGGAEGPGRRMPSPLIQALDANRDGTIDAAELANAPTALAALDGNKDGKLTAEEYEPARPAGTPPPNAKADRPAPPRPPIIAALDANGDGTIDATELAHAAATLKSLDKDGDGTLSVQELRGPRPEGNGPQRRGGPQRRPAPPEQQP
ncbi:MAG: EF-hand domain-containing protein [Verrucomicrobiota bacterium]